AIEQEVVSGEAGEEVLGIAPDDAPLLGVANEIVEADGIRSLDGNKCATARLATPAERRARREGPHAAITVPSRARGKEVRPGGDHGDVQGRQQRIVRHLRTEVVDIGPIRGAEDARGGRGQAGAVQRPEPAEVSKVVRGGADQTGWDAREVPDGRGAAEWVAVEQQTTPQVPLPGIPGPGQADGDRLRDGGEEGGGAPADGARIVVGSQST